MSRRLLAPVDIGAALRDPGEEEDQTRAELSAAARRGGFAAVCPRPRTQPLPTTGQQIEAQLKSGGLVPAGVLTIGGELAELGEMTEAGARVLWDHGERDNALLRAALDYAAGLSERPLIAFDARDADLARGVWSEGPVATRLGLTGIPVAAEVLQVQRVIELSRLTSARVYLSALTSRRAVQAVRAARAEGVAVSASVELAHVILDETALLARPYDPGLRVWPPPRSADDREALREAVRDGTCTLCSGHSPRAAHKQDHEFSRARPGHRSLEDALGVALAVFDDDVVERAFGRAPRTMLGLESDERVTVEEVDATVDGGPLQGTRIAARVVEAPAS